MKREYKADGDRLLWSNVGTNHWREVKKDCEYGYSVRSLASSGHSDLLEKYFYYFYVPTYVCLEAGYRRTVTNNTPYFDYRGEFLSVQGLKHCTGEHGSVLSLRDLSRAIQLSGDISTETTREEAIKTALQHNLITKEQIDEIFKEGFSGYGT